MIILLMRHVQNTETHLTTSFRYKRSKLERQMNLEVVWCVLILIALYFFGAVGSAVWLGAFDEYECSAN